MQETTNEMYGYIRVSTREQNEDRQRLAMEEFGKPKLYGQTVRQGL